jgi:hypothetical protein
MMWLILCVSLLAIIVNGIHWCFRKQSQFIYVPSRGLMGYVQVAWVLLLIVSLIINVLTEVDMVGYAMPLYCAFYSIVSILQRRCEAGSKP